MVVGVALIAIVGFGMGLASFIPPVQRELMFRANSALPNALPEPLSLIDMRYRKLITENAYVESMKKYGFDESNSEIMFNSAQALMAAADLVQAKWRETIDEPEYYKLMKRAHVTKETADNIESVLKYLPSPQDFIRFAVREVFRPDLVEKFGTDEAFPEDIVSEIAKIGMDPEVMRWYWRAHWELPSVSAATEMFHRLNPEWETEAPVDEETFDELLRVKDVMPFWSPRMKKILFRLPTRVDIRRMLRDGHISEAETQQLYRMRGYDEQNASRMVALAKTFYAADEDDPQRKLSVSLILKALEENEISEAESQDFIIGLNYSPEDAELITRLKVIDVTDKELDNEIDTVVSLFEVAAIDELELNKGLDELNIPAARKERLIKQATIRKRKKETLPTKAEVKEFLKKGIIKIAEAEVFLRGQGVREQDIDKYLIAWGKK